jgi:hypothetical protein
VAVIIIGCADGMRSRASGRVTIMAKKATEAKKAQEKAEKPGARKEGLLKPQVAILKVLAKVPAGLSRNGIAEKAGYSSSVAVYKTAGWPNQEKRKEWEAETGHKSLLSLDYVDEKEGVLTITAKGRAALKEALKAE